MQLKNIDSKRAAELEKIRNKNITEINLSQLGFNDDNLDDLLPLLENKAITSLKLKGNRIGPKGVEKLRDTLIKNPSIVHLNLSLNPIGDAGLAALSSLSGRFISLKLEACDLTLNGLESSVSILRIAYLTEFKLKTLALGSNFPNLTMKSDNVKTAQKITNDLKELGIEVNLFRNNLAAPNQSSYATQPLPITSEKKVDADPTNKIGSPRRFDFYNSVPPQPEQRSKLVKNKDIGIFPNNDSDNNNNSDLSSVNLQKNNERESSQILDKKAQKKAKKIEDSKNKKIKQIENKIAENKELQDKIAESKKLKDKIAYSKKLKKIEIKLVGLNINKTNIGEVLRLLDYELVTSLNLSNNQIDPDALQLLVPALLRCQHITKVQLGGNPIEDRGVELLLVLFVADYLESMDLSRCMLSTEALHAIYSAMGKERKMTDLQLGDNFVERHGAEQFLNSDSIMAAEILKSRTTDRNYMEVVLKEEEEAKKQTSNINTAEEKVELLKVRMVKLIKAIIGKGKNIKDDELLKVVFNKNNVGNFGDDELLKIVFNENVVQEILSALNKLKAPAEELEKSRTETDRLISILEDRPIELAAVVMRRIAIINMAILDQSFKNNWNLLVNIFSHQIEYQKLLIGASTVGMPCQLEPPKTGKAFKFSEDWKKQILSLRDQSQGIFIYRETQANGNGLLEAVEISTGKSKDELRQKIISYLEVPENAEKLNNHKRRCRNINKVLVSLREEGDGGDDDVVIYVLDAVLKIRIAIVRKEIKNLFEIVEAKTGMPVADLRNEVISFLSNPKNLSNLKRKHMDIFEFLKLYDERNAEKKRNKDAILSEDRNTNLVFADPKKRVDDGQTNVDIDLSRLIKSLKDGGCGNKADASFVKYALEQISQRPIIINEETESSNEKAESGNNKKKPPVINEELVNAESLQFRLAPPIFISRRNTLPSQSVRYDGLIIKSLAYKEFNNNQGILKYFTDKIFKESDAIFDQIKKNEIKIADLSSKCLSLDMEMLISVLVENNSLTSLDLSNNHFNADDIKLLIEKFLVFKNDFTLILNSNPIGDEGVKYLLDIIINGFSSLELINCGINYGIKAIASTLETVNKDELRLRNLKLACNPGEVDENLNKFFKKFGLNKVFQYYPEFAPLEPIQVISSETPESFNQYISKFRLKNEEIFSIQKTGQQVQGGHGLIRAIASQLSLDETKLRWQILSTLAVNEADFSNLKGRLRTKDDIARFTKSLNSRGDGEDVELLLGLLTLILKRSIVIVGNKDGAGAGFEIKNQEDILGILDNVEPVFLWDPYKDRALSEGFYPCIKNDVKDGDGGILKFHIQQRFKIKDNETQPYQLVHRKIEPQHCSFKAAQQHLDISQDELTEIIKNYIDVHEGELRKRKNDIKAQLEELRKGVDCDDADLQVEVFTQALNKPVSLFEAVRCYLNIPRAELVNVIKSYIDSHAEEFRKDISYGGFKKEENDIEKQLNLLRLGKDCNDADLQIKIFIRALNKPIVVFNGKAGVIADVGIDWKDYYKWRWQNNNAVDPLFVYIEKEEHLGPWKFHKISKKFGREDILGRLLGMKINNKDNNSISRVGSQSSGEQNIKSSDSSDSADNLISHVGSQDLMMWRPGPSCDSSNQSKDLTRVSFWKAAQALPVLGDSSVLNSHVPQKKDMASNDGDNIVDDSNIATLN